MDFGPVESPCWAETPACGLGLQWLFGRWVRHVDRAAVRGGLGDVGRDAVVRHEAYDPSTEPFWAPPTRYLGLEAVERPILEGE